tara:strand:- start:1125 stop:1478 length:354 start_codon:yes stop_codon:yes gene_type:complete
MNSTEKKILKAAAQAMTDPESKIVFNEAEAELIDFLANVDPAYRLRSRYRNQLYAIGRKVKIDGPKDFANEALAAHDRELQADTKKPAEDPAEDPGEDPGEDLEDISDIDPLSDLGA